LRPSDESFPVNTTTWSASGSSWGWRVNLAKMQ